MKQTARPVKAVQKAGFHILIGLTCLLCWVYLQQNLAVALLAGVFSFLLFWKTLPELANLHWPSDRARVIISAALAALFCLMMPISWFYRGNPLYQPLNQLHLPYRVKFLAGVFGNTASLLLIWCLCFLAFFSLWKILKGLQFYRPNRSYSWNSHLKIILLYALPGLLVWFLFLYAYWPGIFSSDSYDVWLQLSGVWQLTDWFPVTYTLFSRALTRIWYNPAVLSIAQIILMAVLWGNAMRLFEQHGLPRKVLLPLSVVFALLPFNPILLVTVWKDIPYAILNFFLVYLLGIIWLTGGEWLRKRGNQVVLGIAVALPFLFRHNGVLILILVPLALLLIFPVRWKSSIVAIAVALVLVLGLRNGIAFGLLKAVPNYESVMYVVPVQHISAVMNQVENAATPQQVEILERVAPISIWQSAYNSYDADTMNKAWGAVNDPEIYQKIGQNKNGLMAVFLDFTLKYPAIVASSEVKLTSILWEFNSPIPYLDRKLDFLLTSVPPFDILDARMFAHPRQNSPLKNALDQYLSLSNRNLFLYAILWKGGVALFLTISCAAIFSKIKGRGFLLLCVPTFANVLSLAVSIPVPNFRYVYPYVICTFLIVLFGLLPNATPSSEKASK